MRSKSSFVSGLCFMLFSLVLFNFCAASNVDVSDQEAVSDAVELEKDNFQKTESYKGPSFKSGDIESVSLFAYKSRLGKMSYSVNGIDLYGKSWRYYDTAYDSAGKKLKFTSLHRKVSSCDTDTCTYAEIFSIDVTRGYLERYKEKGIDIQISGKMGKEIFNIPPSYIKGFLSAVPSHGKNRTKNQK